MNNYLSPDIELISYTADDVLSSSKPDEYTVNGMFNAEGSAAGWVVEDLV